MAKQLTQERWLFSTPLFLMLLSIMLAGNAIYPEHVPIWYRIALLAFALFCCASLVHSVRHLLNSDERTPGTKPPKISPKLVAGISVSLTANIFFFVTYRSLGHVSVPLVEFYLFASLVSAVLLAMGAKTERAAKHVQEEVTGA
jgi:hypothetical membrane protein